MRILSRYFVSRFLGLFAAILAASILAIVIIEMLLNLDQMLELEPGAAGVLTYLFLRLPSYYLKDLLPVASFGAAFFALGMAARWHEITAIKAGGISPLRATIPVLCAAAVLAAAAFVVNETWVVSATQEWKSRLTGGGQALDYRRGSFWYSRGRTIYNVSGADRETRTLEGVRLFERDRSGRLLRSIHAERAHIEENGLWRFEEAVIRRFAADDLDRPPSVERVAEARLAIAGNGETALMGADASLLSLRRLHEYIQVRVRDGEPAQRLAALFHGRLTDPLAVLLLALLGAPLGLRAERSRSFGQPALLGVAAVTAFFLLRTIGQTLGSEGVVPAGSAAWSVVAVAAGVGFWQLARIPR